MEKVVNFIKQNEEEMLYIQYWLKQPVIERLKEVTRLRYNYYKWLNKSFPDKIEKVVNRQPLAHQTGSISLSI
ncbi:hypothetical protein [Mucilaginibacter sp.]|jgi:hypothetical protein|uniref:hypothetical protein n=1 Tax=Mucilaginibacter sp. TaxID=1882438 RepID=UPI003564CBB8